MKKFASFLLFAALTFAVFPARAAAESPWVSADYLQARLISAPMVADGNPGAVQAALELRLGEGWHVFWRVPGDGGLPPKLDWSASENVDTVDISWPAPHRIETYGLYSFGYEEHVVLPLLVLRGAPDVPARIDLKADIMVCKDICVPQQAALSLDIPAQGTDGRRYEGVIARALAAVPLKEDTPGLKLDSMVLGPDAIVVRAYAAKGWEDADLFIESGDLYLTAPPQIEPDKDDARYATLRVAKPEGVENLFTALSGVPLALTLTAGGQAVEKNFNF